MRETEARAKREKNTARYIDFIHGLPSDMLRTRDALGRLYTAEHGAAPHTQLVLHAQILLAAQEIEQFLRVILALIERKREEKRESRKRAERERKERVRESKRVKRELTNLLSQRRIATKSSLNVERALAVASQKHRARNDMQIGQEKNNATRKESLQAIGDYLAPNLHRTSNVSETAEAKKGRCHHAH